MLTDADLQAIRERAETSSAVHPDDVFDLLTEVERLRASAGSVAVRLRVAATFAHETLCLPAPIEACKTPSCAEAVEALREAGVPLCGLPTPSAG